MYQKLKRTNFAIALANDNCLLSCGIVVTSDSGFSLMSALDKLYRKMLNNSKGLGQLFCIVCHCILLPSLCDYSQVSLLWDEIHASQCYFPSQCCRC